MKYLILEKHYAEYRNWKAAKDDGCKAETTERWDSMPVSEAEVALVIDGGEHLLTDEELKKLVDDVPISLTEK